MKNFAIPFNIEALQSSSNNQYTVDEVFSSRTIPIKLQAAKVAFSKEGGIAVLQHFDVVYSIICKFDELDTSIRQQTWDMLLKAGKNYGMYLASLLTGKTSESPQKLNPECRNRHKNAVKMIVYLLVQMADLFQGKFNQMNEAATRTISSGKKRTKSTKSKSDDDPTVFWIGECEILIRLLMTYVDLDIHRLWEPSLVEDDFLNQISSICYKMLESHDLYKNASIKSPIFHVLGCLLKKFDQVMSTGLKILQLLQHFSYLASALAEGVSMWHETYKCKTIVTGVLREISHIPEDEFVRDSDSAKNIGVFLVELSKCAPSATLANFSLMLERMNEESYSMRNTVLVMMGEIILKSLSGEGLDDKAKSARDQFLDYLHDHANLDPNAFTRSKSLQIWIMLVKEQALPLKRYPELVELCESLLLDKSNLVRKFSVQLLNSILQFNPFASKLPLDVLQDGRDDAKLKLAQLEEAGAKVSPAPQTTESSEDAENDRNVAFEDGENMQSESQETENKEDPEITKQKDIVNYLNNSVQFVERLQACVPALCDLLRSKVHTDVIEAIGFFTVACQFNLSFAFIGVTAMLQQIWHEEQKIRDAVVAAYRLLYFTPEASTPRARAGMIVDNLMNHMSVSSVGKLKSLEALLKHLSQSDDITSGIVQTLWDRFTKPELNNSTSINTVDTYEQQKLAVQLIGFLANSNPSIVKSKIDVLVTHGLLKVLEDFPEAPERLVDFSLAFHTCETLGQLQTKKVAAGKYRKCIRLPETHDLFSCLHQLMMKGFSHKSANWEHFSMEAISLIYELSERPDKLCELIIQQMLQVIQENSNITDTKTKSMLVARFYMIVGQVGIKHLVYLEVAVQSEVKHRRKLKEKKEESEKKKSMRRSVGRRSGADKSDTNLEEDMGVGGATADDAEQEFIRNITENEILSKDNLLGMLAPCLVRACFAQTNISPSGVDVAIEATASLALAKLMQISSKFCEDHLQVLFTLLEKSTHEIVRANLVVPIGDLCVRFPNLLEPWTAHLYARLKDESSLVRIYAVKVLSNLILNDMVKVKGHVSEMARCTVDRDENIMMLTKKFFTELSTKGNAIYNVMPDIISRLSAPDAEVEEEQFHEIMKFLFTFIQKEKHSESLVEKLCHRFQATRTRRQWQDLALCLSFLSYSEKSVRRLQENFSLFADKLADEKVYQCFSSIVAKAKKLTKSDVKVQVEELGTLIDECHQKGVSDDQTAAKAAAVVKKSRKGSSIRSPRASIAWPARSPLAGDDVATKPTAKRKRNIDFDDSESDEDFHSSGEAENPQPAANSKSNVALRVARKINKPMRRVTINFSSDSEEDETKENYAIIQSTAEAEEPPPDLEDSNDTPIRRKKTPARRMTRSRVRT